MHKTPFLKQLSCDKASNEFTISADQGLIKLEIINESAIRVLFTKRDHSHHRESLMMLPRKRAVVEYKYSEDIDTVSIHTSQMSLVISKQTGAFQWRDSRNRLLVREPEKGGKTLEETPVEITTFDTNTHMMTEESADGARTHIEGAHKQLGRMAYASKLDLVFSEGEAIYGLGQHEEGIFNYRGHRQILYQHNMKLAIPMIVSTRGYAILWDTYSLSAFHDDEHGTYFWSEIDDEMNFTFIYGPEFDQIVAHYRELTGDVPMLPMWAFGYLQSKERYVDQQELLNTAREYRQREIPIDCIIQDWQTWPEGLWGQKSFDTTRFPNPEKLTRDLHEINVKWMISIWPHMRGNGPNQQEMHEKSFLLGNQSTYAAFNPAARELYWKQVNEGLFRYGVDGWWSDCTEPFEKDWYGIIKPEPWKRAVVNSEEAKTYLDPEFINAYSLLHSRMIYEGQRSVTTEKRVVNLTRSYSPGQQRYGTIVWSGDIAATWETLHKQIAEGLNFTVTGGSKWTLDIGGFFVKPQDQGRINAWFWCGDYPNGHEDEGYRELYIRWFQLGTFLPMFRSHGTDTPREVWRFGNPGTRTYDTLVNFDVLRYRLLPYIYSVAGWETHCRYTMLRNLAFDFRHDPKVYNIADQFMFGPAIMVCPVTKPMYFGADSQKLEGIKENRSVYLPSGSNWFDFWTGNKFAGGQTIETPAPLEICPLFVRAGSVIPIGPKVQHSADSYNSPWELRIYPGANSMFSIYEDEGDGYGYEAGECAWTPLQWSDDQRILTLKNRKGSFPGMKVNREFQVIIVKSNHGIGIEPEPAMDNKILYEGNQLRLKFSGK